MKLHKTLLYLLAITLSLTFLLFGCDFFVNPLADVRDSENFDFISIWLTQPIDYTQIEGTSATLLWDSNADSFDVYMSTDSTIVDYRKLDGRTGIDTFIVDSLDYSSVYYWKVMARVNGEKKLSPMETFITDEVLTLALLHPPSDTTNLSSTVEFIWNGNGTAFELYIDPDTSDGWSTSTTV